MQERKGPSAEFYELLVIKKSCEVQMKSIEIDKTFQGEQKKKKNGKRKRPEGTSSKALKKEKRLGAFFDKKKRTFLFIRLSSSRQKTWMQTR